MASYNFSNYNNVKVNGTDISTVKFNGSTIWTKPPATRSTFTYSTTRDNITHGQTSSNSKTFGGLPVTAGSTTIKVVGNVYTHVSNHGIWTNRSYNIFFYLRYKVALYSGSTLLHTTGWCGYSSGNINVAWKTNTSKDITKAILYINGAANGRSANSYCHAYSNVTLTIG